MKSWSEDPALLRRLLIIGGLQSLWTYHSEKDFIEILSMVIGSSELKVTEKQFVDNLYDIIKSSK